MSYAIGFCAGVGVTVGLLFVLALARAAANGDRQLGVGEFKPGDPYYHPTKN